MTNPAAHTLLDQLLNEVKQNLVDDHIDKMKTDILNVVAKKQENFLQDMVQICDSISRDTVDATMNAAAQMIQNQKQEMLDFIRAMVQKEVSIEVEKLKMAVEKEKEEEVGTPMGEDTEPALAEIFVRKNLFKPEVYEYLRQQQEEQMEESQSHIHSFMKKTQKEKNMTQNDPIWPQMTKNGPKMTQNGPKMTF